MAPGDSGGESIETGTLPALTPAPGQPLTCGNVGSHLSAYADRELGESDSRRIEAHLAACAVCRADLSAFARLSDGAQRLPVPQLRDADFAPVLAGIRRFARGLPAEPADETSAAEIVRHAEAMPVPRIDGRRWEGVWAKVRARTVAAPPAWGAAADASEQTATGERLGAAGAATAPPDGVRRPFAARWWWGAAAMAVAASILLVLTFVTLPATAPTHDDPDLAQGDAKHPLDEVLVTSPKYQVVVRMMQEQPGRRSPPVVCFVLRK